ncbi:hypothetical protein [Streptomyces sp. NPDC054887]
MSSSDPANTETTQTDDDRYDDELPPTPAPATPAEWDGLIDEWIDAEPDILRGVLEMLARPERDAAREAALAGGEIRSGGEGERSWYGGGMSRETWACPRNLAGFARSLSN